MTAQKSNVSSSFAWAQLFAGSLISGLAVWKLVLKVMHSEPSKILWGLAATYEAWRNWLVTPLELFHLGLTPSEKNVLIICLTLLGAVLRAVLRFPELLGALILGFVFSWIFVGFFLEVTYVAHGFHSEPINLQNIPMFHEVRMWIIGFALVTLLLSLFTPVINLLFGGFGIRRYGRPIDVSPLHSLVILNIVFTVGWGAFLLLLNSATS